MKSVHPFPRSYLQETFIFSFEFRFGSGKGEVMSNSTQSLASSSSSSFKVIDSILKVSLLPCHTEYPLLAVKEQIHELLFHYDESLLGVPISYHEMKLPVTKEYGRIMNELPWLHIDISVKFLVFQPQPNDLISGQINKVK